MVEGQMEQVASPTKSTFVTVLAWIFIVITGFGLFISLLQNIMINVAFPVEQMNQIMAVDTAPGMPKFFRFMFGNIRLFFYFFFAVCLLTFECAIGLLKRKEWARISFIAIMGLGILWNIGGLFFQHFFFNSMNTEFPMPEGDSTFRTMQTVMAVFMAVFGIGFSALFAFIIAKLSKATVKSEFQKDKSIWTIWITLPVVLALGTAIAARRPTVQPDMPRAVYTGTPVQIRSVPKMASVEVNGIFLGTANTQTFYLDPGEHELRLDLDGLVYDTLISVGDTPFDLEINVEERLGRKANSSTEEEQAE